MNKKLLFVVNVDWAFLLNRLPIAVEAKRVGYDVHVATCITNKLEELISYGFTVHPLPMQRGQAGIIREVFAFLRILLLFLKIRPDIVHLVTIKPVLFGGISARLVGLKAVVAAVPGLGSVFLSTGFKAAVRRYLVGFLYSISLNNKNMRVIFQNKDDCSVLKEIAGIDDTRISLIRGSGVDLRLFSNSGLPDGIPAVILVARLISEKGVREFVEAARIIKGRNIEARFCLVGEPDPLNPSGISEGELSEWEKEGVVELFGNRDDMHLVYRLATIVVLPSYREGLPKVLIEAAACGRPVITTDVPGCRDAIENGVTGLLVPVRDPVLLAEKIELLLSDRDRCLRFGNAGRVLAENEFDIRSVVQKHLDIYEELIKVSK